MPIRTLAAGAAAAAETTPTSFEIDFSGSGGALSNGTVTLDGHDFTLAGVGSSYNLYFSIPLADLFADYDGTTCTVEATVDMDGVSWTQQYTMFCLKRADIAGATQLGATFTGKWNFAGWYDRSTSRAYQLAQSNIDGSPEGNLIDIPYSTMDPKRIGMIAAGQATIGSHTEVATGSPVRVALDAGGGGYVTEISDGTVGTANPFGTSDVLMVQALKYSTSGGTATTTATQTASGVEMAIGASTVTIKKLYIYIGTPDIT